MAKEIKVKTIVVTTRNGKREEATWESLSQEEKSWLSVGLTERFMKSVGYKKVTA